MTSRDLRRKFIEFFVEQGHVHVPSSSLIPEEETGLLFTTAGMVQFRDHYLHPERAPFGRAVTVQKCLRAGGKDSDIESVGRTARHMTFFEMLGNFSFGDYFKQEAVEWGWEFVTRVLGMSPERLWVSVYEEDDESRGIWHGTAGLPQEKIVGLSKKDNFWGPAGLSGVCGPCSEIYFDAGEGVGCGRDDCRPGCDCDRFVEFWNLVFPQFFQEPDGTMRPLGRPGIDTGMGLERLAAIMQGAPNVFETDGLKPLIRAVREVAEGREASHRLVATIADHSRSLAFAIADGVLPSNEGRGYVLRRILRRAVRAGQELGIEGPFITPIVGRVIDLMGGVYPELNEQREHIAGVVAGEEDRFLRTLEQGVAVFEEVAAGVEASGERTIPGDQAFRLYDTYGFPLDLTEELAAERGLRVDRVGFERHMNRQKERAKGSSRLGRAEQVAGAARGPRARFTGYETDAGEAEVIGLTQDGSGVDSVGPEDEVEVFLSETPFYGESGGQVGDRGMLVSDSVRVEVHGTELSGEGSYIHRGRVLEGTLRVGMKVTARIDSERRRAIERHHTGTHLLQAALREVLGKHVKQSGSLVGPDGFRFDFTHPSALDADSLEEIEHRVNRMILANTPVEILIKSVGDAREMGALAFFGEKYGAEARVVRIGDISLELCGGTHVRAVGEIGSLRIIRESSIGAGLRRIEAVAGEAAYELSRRQGAVLADAAAVLRGGWEEVPEKARQLLSSRVVLEKELEEVRLRGTGGKEQDLLGRAQTVGRRALLVERVDGLDSGDLGRLVDAAKSRFESGVFVLTSAAGRKIALVVGITEDLADGKTLHAGTIAKDMARDLGGNGGGKATFAQGAGRTPELLDEVLANLRSDLTAKLSSA